VNNLVELVLSNQIVNQFDLYKYYAENANEIGTSVNIKTTIYGIVEDYKKAVELLIDQNVTINDIFNRKIFTQILAKIKAIGITNWKSEISDFKIYRAYLIQEISKKDNNAAESFSRIISEENIKNTDKELLKLFYQGFSHYVEIAVNLHQYTKTTIEQNNRIGNSFFEDMKNKYNNYEMKKDIENVKQFLNNLIKEIVDDKEYKVL
jgi:hypothetical protein